MNCERSSVIISGMGSYIPEKVLTNLELSRIVETSDEWIVTRTGIRERRVAAETEACSDLAVAAARRAIEDAGITPDEIDLVIVGTITPDMPFPSTACLVQHKLGLRKVMAFDVEAACSGFLYCLEVGARMLQAGHYRNALVIGTEKLSSIMDWEDRSTCILFGDGAGAAILTRSEQLGVGIIESLHGADGADASILWQPGGGSSCPASVDSITSRQHYLKMNGREVFKWAVRVMEQSCLDLLKKHGIEADQVACVVPHQANLRIIELLASRMKLPMEKFFVNLDRYGNTSAASIPIALDEARRAECFGEGDYVLLVAFGAGLTWGATLLKWQKE